MRYATIAAAVAIASILPGCSETKVDNCWSPSTKLQATTLIRRAVLEYIDRIAKTEGPLTDAVKKEIDQRTSVELSDFYVVSKDEAVGHLSCGAQVQFSYLRPDQKTISGDSTLQFEIYKAESGSEYSIPTAPVAQMVDAANQ